MVVVRYGRLAVTALIFLCAPGSGRPFHLHGEPHRLAVALSVGPPVGGKGLKQFKPPSGGGIGAVAAWAR